MRRMPPEPRPISLGSAALRQVLPRPAEHRFSIQILSGSLDQLGPRSRRSRLMAIDSLLAKVVMQSSLPAQIPVVAARSLLSATASHRHGLFDWAPSCLRGMIRSHVYPASLKTPASVVAPQ